MSYAISPEYPYGCGRFCFHVQCPGQQSDRCGAGRHGDVHHSSACPSDFYDCVADGRMFCSFPRVILGVYTNIPDLIAAAIPSLWVYCTTPLLIAPGNIYFQAVSGTGNTRKAFILELVTLSFTPYIYTLSSNICVSMWLGVGRPSTSTVLHPVALLCLHAWRQLEVEEDIMHSCPCSGKHLPVQAIRTDISRDLPVLF